MKIYLACTEIRGIEDLIPGSDILEAFPYIRNNKTMIDLIPACRNFILDSGVFTMINSGKRFDIDEYLDGYAAFIKEHKIKHRFLVWVSLYNCQQNADTADNHNPQHEHRDSYTCMELKNHTR